MKRFADVILPLPIAGEYTYSLPAGMAEGVSEGCRVVVPFGRKKFYTAIVTRLHDTPPQEYETKDVAEVLDAGPVLLAGQYKLWQWIADYYLCTPGDVYKAAMPSGMKLESETVVAANPDFEAGEPLAEREQRVMDALPSNAELCITQLERATGIARLMPVVKSLLEKGAIRVKEELKRSYKPRTETRVRLAAGMREEEALARAFDVLARAPRQLDVLMKYIELSGWSRSGKETSPVGRKRLAEAAGVSVQVVGGLLEKGILEAYVQETGRLETGNAETEAVRPLAEAQRVAYEKILHLFGSKDVCLLHGVTSGGKTEIYIHLIRQAMAAGKQTLYLLPEIALTAQLTERLRRVFGNRLGVYHSKFPDAERVEIWQKQLTTDDYDVILGARSSVFLPFRRLGLVIVDEEHETSYKQQDPAPRYHARSAAIVLASMYRAKVLLGTATPSVESYYNALSGKFGLVELTERYGDAVLPHIEPVDIKELYRKKRMSGPFSPFLLQKMRESLEAREQVILFQNRRGFAPMVECRACGWVPRCKNCDVSLTYHKGTDVLTCHYCGYTYRVPRACPACGGTELASRGFGTEKIEDDIRQIFPEARVARMDFDTTRTRSAYERIIADFEAGKTDILIGTQMVSKGLDFDRVSVVGILDADLMMNYPDFRAHERAFQLMAQVAGRAGRRGKRGLVALQTKSADMPLVRQVMENDYRSFYLRQADERRSFRYPPFCRLVYVYLKHRKEDVLGSAAQLMADCLRGALGDRVLGPDRPPVSRIQALYIKKIVIKVEPQASMSKIRAYLKQVQASLTADGRFRSLTVYYDVDPL